MGRWRGLALIGTSAALAVPLTTVNGSAAATKTKTLKTTTFKVKPSGKTARLELTAQGRNVTMTLAVKMKHKGKWAYKLLATQKLKRTLPVGYGGVRLTAFQTGEAYEKNGGQGLVGWVGPAEGNSDDFFEYFGWNIDKRKIGLFGQESRR